MLSEGPKVYMVMEYAENGSLFGYQNLRRTFSEEEASVFFEQTLAAVEYLHARDFVHRDLKPENLLLDRDLNIKVCDFGWIVEGARLPHSTFCGTYEYMAPEMLFQRHYDHRVDIWALGVLLYELLHGAAPFEGDSLEAVRDAMLEGEIRIDPAFSHHLQNLIFNLLKVDPDDRITIEDIKAHPWMTDMKKLRLTALNSILSRHQQ